MPSLPPIWDVPPPAVPVYASTKNTAFKGMDVPLGWGVQVAPPSVVRTMTAGVGGWVPPPPTAVPVLESTKETPRRSTGDVVPWSGHPAPPSLLRTSLPWAPTPGAGCVPDTPPP